MPEFLVTTTGDLLELISTRGALWFYMFLYASCVTEGLFPPYPGDTVILLGGFFASLGKLDYFLVFFLSATGSLTGAMILYYLGKKRGRRIFSKGKILNPLLLGKIEGWFRRYGDKVILASRFLAGVRSGVALTAGVGNVRTRIMVLYSLISIFLWNGMIIFTAGILGKNWQGLYRFLVIYNRIVLTLLGAAIIVGLIYYFIIRKSKANIPDER
ncbi:MAG: DedA family protein [Candidatus Zixiibacteriota bacterium]